MTTYAIGCAAIAVYGRWLLLARRLRPCWRAAHPRRRVTSRPRPWRQRNNGGHAAKRPARELTAQTQPVVTEVPAHAA